MKLLNFRAFSSDFAEVWARAPFPKKESQIMWRETNVKSFTQNMLKYEMLLLINRGGENYWYTSNSSSYEGLNPLG